MFLLTEYLFIADEKGQDPLPNIIRLATLPAPCQHTVLPASKICQQPSLLTCRVTKAFESSEQISFQKYLEIHHKNLKLLSS